ncbi:hypothetical protein Gpo141_00015112, partial [Globisporangium polare]
DDEFFSDLPMRGRRSGGNATGSQAAAPPATGGEDTATKTQPQPQDQQRQSPQEETATNSHPFSTYSFSNSTIVDDKGRRVVSMRRRYEDSSGRLKALHERQIEGQTMRAVWDRQHKDDEGQHEQICSSGTPEEFEAAWKQTPFGAAHAQHAQLQQHEAIKDKGDEKKKESAPAAKAS